MELFEPTAQHGPEPARQAFLLTMVGEETAVLATAAFVGVAILGVAIGAVVLVLYSNRMAAEIGDLAARAATGVKGRFNRKPVEWGGSNFERFRADVVDILKRRWHLLTLATLVELSLTAALIGFGGNNAGVVAAVLVFRFLTIVPTLVLGIVAAGVWRRLLKRAPATG